MTETARVRARQLAHDFIQRGDPIGWFETLYAEAKGNERAIQWADMAANPNLVSWFENNGTHFAGARSLVIGCGLGDDAEYMASKGLQVTAFDLSPTAVSWAQQRFPDTRVQYRVADVCSTPQAWTGAFDLIIESYTLQVLPVEVRRQAMAAIAQLVAPAGTLLIITRGRDPDEDEGKMPWPLTRAELELFQTYGLTQVRFEEYLDQEEPPVRRFRVQYRK
ncbi:class I SAM-dependent methyltransferase [Ktedonosporobacter rubrisoli]|uniref:Class I SAM-dependent methyltransferase n=1 Tax=Ktedonosporobacter rubrisoli TaxID=2509675 RepID=A0A4P6JSH8_KTERU|nr:class I SAM-dependent methyltransferase [Ktedonosporobacter rubrisoli]QBD78489.1 class I SAM-dependent methyltransferase [Ktedonosporobacter rubrisoli]